MKRCYAPSVAVRLYLNGTADCAEQCRQRRDIAREYPLGSDTETEAVANAWEELSELFSACNEKMEKALEIAGTIEGFQASPPRRLN